MRNIVAVLVVVVVGVASAPAGGQTPADARQEILDYQLSAARADQLIAALEAMTKYLVSLPDFQDRLVKAMKMSPAEQRAQLDKDPKAMAILKANGLTSHDYLVGVPALRMALMAAQGVTAPTVIASPANTAFARANLSRLKPKMDAADGLGARK
ncbi:MAG: hypothetical protein ACT4QD_19130 [Acidobacteriota bacterium]